ncbi:MAG: oxidoreductase [Actinobacteria bacterium HGW-Actinobacteria-4]|nr:MAG: oxidoreductase [Actinobacteria bacterium HGW-Actinobacteria-4]
MNSRDLRSPHLTTNNGLRIPQLGFGVWQIEDHAEEVILDAIEVGYRHLDTAMIYHNEREVGRAVTSCGVPRKELFVTTKLFNTDHGTDEAFAAFDASLDRLALDYVDLYLIHWPMPGVDRYVESWKALERIADSGRAKAIGVSNFMPDHLERLAAETGTVPAVNQIELHPEHQQAVVSSYNSNHGILTEAYSPLANGRVLDHPSLAAIATKHGKSVPQVLLRWHMDKGNVAIPKTSTRARMVENLNIFDFSLDAAEIDAIDAFERGPAARVGNDPYEVNGP